MDDIKRCNKCGEDVQTGGYRTVTHKRGYVYLSPWCKNCEYKYNRERLAKRFQVVWDYLDSRSCCDCGEEDNRVLEFDHISDDKNKAISVLWRSGKMEALQAEMEKCEVVCANCHRKRTYSRHGENNFRERLWQKSIGG